MLRRFLVISFVLGTALLLMFLHNTVFTGTQEIFADLVAVDEGTAWQITFKDISDRRVTPTTAEQEEIARRLGAPGIDAKDKAGIIPVQQLELKLTGERCIRLVTTTSDDPQEEGTRRVALKKRIQDKPFIRTNPARPFYHIALGIDLQGGVEFSCALIDMDGQRVFADENTVDILRKRLDARGLTEPVVSRLGNGDVEIVIPGGTTADAARTRKVLETTGSLEMRELLEVFGDVSGSYKYRDKRPQQREPGHDIIDNEDGSYSLNPDSNVFLARSEGQVLYAHKAARGEKPTLFMKLGPAELTGDDIESANVGHNTTSGDQAVNINFKATGGQRNSVFTTRIKTAGVTGYLAVCMDRVVESAPIVISPSGNACQITGRFSEEEAKTLQTVFTAGALKVRPEVQSERVVGASLGAEAVSKGLISMVSAVLLVLGIMLLYYRGLGTVAVASLTVCVGLIYAVLVVFNATMTLPGIAGLVLTVGMAVDANILIFERIREELRDDVDLATSIDVGYSRAFGTILDSNLTTFIAALILYVVGTAQVKGFGLTLMIGLATSMFSAIYIGRMLTEIFYRNQEHPRIAGFLRESWFAWDFVRYRYLALLLSLGVLGAGIFGLLRPGDINHHYNIDFTGGHAVQVTFDRPMDSLAVDQVLNRPDLRQRFAMLDSVQRQAYYADFANAGNASRQWVFKTADVPGIEIERRLRVEEKAYVDLVRQLRIADAADKKDPELIGRLQMEVDAKSIEMQAIRGKLQERTDLVKQELIQAFNDVGRGPDAGRVPAEGAEVLGAAWHATVLDLDLEVLKPANDDQRARLAARMVASHDEITAAEILPTESADGRPGLRFHLTFVTEPKAVDQALEEEDPVYQRLLGYVEKAADNVGLARGQAQLALRTYEYAVQDAAALTIRVAKPFPATEHFSSTVGDATKWRALVAMSIALVAILLYVAARFEFTFGIGSVIALIHDVVLTVGLLMLMGIRIDLTVIAGLLAIIGYSLNDTIVIFDRIREIRQRQDKPLRDVINLAISQTMSRTLLTTITTLVVVVILFVFGGDGLRPFSATLIIGLMLGTYSTVYVASPILLIFQNRLARRKEAEAAAELAAAPERTPDADLPRLQY